MAKREKEDAIKSVKLSMTGAAQTLHDLMKQRKEVLTVMREKDKEINSSFTKDLNEIRENERKKRLELYGQKEQERQKITSVLIMSLLQISEEEDVPRYIRPIAEVLDNYQGKSYILISSLGR